VSAGEPQRCRWLLARPLSLVALARFSSAHLAFSAAAALNRLASPCLQSTLVTDLLRAGRRNGGAPACCQWYACASSGKISRQPRGAGPRGADQRRGLHVLQLIFDPFAIGCGCCTCEDGDKHLLLRFIAPSQVRMGDVRDADSLKSAAAGCENVVAAHGMSPPRFAKLSDIWYSSILYITCISKPMTLTDKDFQHLISKSRTYTAHLNQHH